MSRSLSDFINRAGIKTAAVAPTTPAPAAAPVAAAPVKVAAAPAAKPAAKVAEGTTQPTTEPAGGKKPRDKITDAPAQDTKAAEFCAVAGRTEAQKWLASHGVFVEDVKTAELLAGQQAKLAEIQKQAELEKLAEEERSRGAIFYQGMVKESTALRLAFNQAELADVQKVAAALGIDAAAIMKRAEEMASAVHTASPALVGDHLGTAARVNSSKTLETADKADQTPAYRPDAVAGTRAPVSGHDEKLVRMTDIWTLPGNPGLNLGQAVDQGKGL